MNLRLGLSPPWISNGPHVYGTYSLETEQWVQQLTGMKYLQITVTATTDHACESSWVQPQRTWKDLKMGAWGWYLRSGLGGQVTRPPFTTTHLWGMSTLALEGWKQVGDTYLSVGEQRAGFSRVSGPWELELKMVVKQTHVLFRNHKQSYHRAASPTRL